MRGEIGITFMRLQKLWSFTSLAVNGVTILHALCSGGTWLDCPLGTPIERITVQTVHSCIEIRKSKSVQQSRTGRFSVAIRSSCARRRTG